MSGSPSMWERKLASRRGRDTLGRSPSLDSAMRAPSLLALCAVALAATPLRAQSLDPRFLSALVWRNVGPFRAGRVSAVSGGVGQPGVFYFGAANGGGSKATIAGLTCDPLFVSIKTLSAIGAVSAGPAEPSVIYVRT